MCVCVFCQEIWLIKRLEKLSLLFYIKHVNAQQIAKVLCNFPFVASVLPFFNFPICSPSIILPHSDSDVINSHSSSLHSIFSHFTHPFLCSAVTVSQPWACKLNSILWSHFIHLIHPLGMYSLTLNDRSHGWMINSYNLTYEFVLIIGFLPLFICSPPSCFLLLLLR